MFVMWLQTMQDTQERSSSQDKEERGFVVVFLWVKFMDYKLYAINFQLHD